MSPLLKKNKSIERRNRRPVLSPHIYLALAMQGENARPLMALGGWESPAMLSHYAHLSSTHRWKAVESGEFQVGTVTEPVAEEWAGNEQTQKL